MLHTVFSSHHCGDTGGTFSVLDLKHRSYRKFIKSGNEERLQDGSRPGALRASFSKVTTFFGQIFHLIMQ